MRGGIDAAAEERRKGMGRGRIVVGLAVGAWTLGAAAACAAEAKTTPRAVSGEVIAAEGKSNTLVVKGKAGAAEIVVGVEVTDKTKISGGKAKLLTDINPGDRVSVKYTRYDNDAVRFVADAITVQTGQK
jgi:hypothetical protein